MHPKLNGLSRSRDITVTLRGLNLTSSVGDGEWAWTQNVDTALCPIIRRREKRLKVGRVDKPGGLFATDRLAFVDGTKFYYNGYYYGDVADSFKQMAAMGSKICIFPDKVIFDTETCSFSPMEQRNKSSGTVKVTLARGDGTPWGEYTSSAIAPENPSDGMNWLDTSGETPVMKIFSATTGLWTEEASVYVCVESTGIGAGLKADDAVTVAGLEAQELNGDWILQYTEDDRIIFTGVLAAEQTQTAQVTVERVCPDMDFIVERNNRLWGCSGEKHEIYCCALGDPTNWRRYAGLSTDSYAVTVGSPGPFTGMAVVGGSVVAFKEACIHKVYGEYPAAFQLYTYNYRGVEAGSARSLVRIGSMLYYKSVFDWCAFDGSEVLSISSPLGTHRYKNAVAGANDRRLYVSQQDETGAWQLMTYDTVRGLWMREDSLHALAFIQCQTETFLLAEDGGLWAVRAGEYAKDFFMLGSDYKAEATEETDAEAAWLVRTGELLQGIPDNKRVSRIQALLDLSEGAWAEVWIRRDGGAWEKTMRMEGQEKRRYQLPIYPRRCDRLEVEIRGQGDVRIINLSRAVEAGSEHR